MVPLGIAAAEGNETSVAGVREGGGRGVWVERSHIVWVREYEGITGEIKNRQKAALACVR